MLKTLFINGKKVPVPVPLENLEQARLWIESTFAQGGKTITRIVLDRKEVLFNDEQAVDVSFSSGSRLEVQLDSAVDLTIQLLETMRNLASVIESCLKQVAVECWQAPSQQPPESLSGVLDDLELVVDLLEHLDKLTAGHEDAFSVLVSTRTPLTRAYQAIHMARANSDWKACARILLNTLEPQVTDIVNEACRGQSYLIGVRSQPGRNDLAR